MRHHISTCNRLGTRSTSAIAAVLSAIIFSKDLSGTRLFSPYGACDRWIPSLVILHPGTNMATGLPYLFISSTLLFITLRLVRLPYQTILSACSVFISGTTTHFLEVITILFTPLDWFTDCNKLMTVLVSIWIAILLPLLIPKGHNALTNARQVKERNRKIPTFDENYTTIANAMPILVLVGNAQGHAEFFNSAWKSYTGCGYQELLEGLAKGKFIHPDDFQRIRPYWDSQVQQGLAFECELRLKRYDNIYRWHLIHMAVISQNGAIRQWVGTGTDINKQKSNEQALRETHQRRDIFLTMISHELKTPLTSIQLLISFIHREISDPKYQQAILTIEEQLQRLIQLINDLLDMSKIKAGQMSLTFIVCDAIKIASETIAKIQIGISTHKLIMKCDTEECYIEADAERLEQIIVNLLTNAIKYSPQADRVDIRITSDEHNLCFAVQDYGIGIIQEAQTHIFKQYYRSIEASHQKYGGLGIGLYITSEIVKRHSGHLWVESQEGKGSIFSFSLPLKKEERTKGAA